METQFNETSKVFKPSFFFTLMPAAVILGFLLFKEVKEGDTVGTVICVAAILINIVFAFILRILRLTVVLNDEGVMFRYQPYHKESVVYKWEEIQSIEIITFDPLTDFGGWGRKRSKVYGSGFLTTGNKAIFIVDKKGQKTTLSVLDPVKANQVIKMNSNAASHFAKIIS